MGKPKRVVSDVRIATLAAIPPKYFLRPKVIQAIRREVLHDLKKNLKRVPAGVEASYKEIGPVRQLLTRLRILK